jgi:hypothetical protein
MAKRNIIKAEAAVTTRTASAIGADIVAALRDKETANGKADVCFKEAASALDAITANWTLVKFNQCKSPDSTKAALTAAGVSDSEGAKIVEFLAPVKEAVTAFNAESWKTVVQGIRRWSKGYTGSKPNHPDAKAAKPAAKPAAEPAATTTEVSVSDQVARNPQFARVVVSHVIAGLTSRMGEMKREKVSIANIKEAIAALGEANEFLALMK